MRVNIKFLLCLIASLFIVGCDDGVVDSNDSGAPEPVTIVSMGLSGVPNDFADNTDLQDSFRTDLASSLGMSDPDRIQILSISVQRGDVSLELLFLESNDNSAPSISDLLSSVVEVESVGDYAATVELTVADDSQSAQYMLDAANQALEDYLVYVSSCDYDDDCSEFGEFNGDINPFSPMESIHGLYLNALEFDSSNPEANFGAAITGLVTITTDQTLIDFLEDWDEWEQDNTHFPSMVTSEESNGRSGGSKELFPGLSFSPNSFFMLKDMDVMSFLPLNHLFKYYVATNNSESNANSSSGRNHPSIINKTSIRNEVSMNISSIQNLLDDVLVSRLTNTIGYLDNIVGQDYKFTITPSMQGDDDQDPLQIDDTEFYLMKGYMHMLRSVLYMVTAYNLDMPMDIESESDFAPFQQDGDFLTLHSGRENNFSSAHSDINSVLASLLSAYAHLQNDNDTTNDIVLWGDIESHSMDFEGESYTVSEFLGSEGPVYQMFNSSMDFPICSCEVENDWGDCLDEDCVDIAVNLSNFMTNAPSNLKTIIPGYVINVESEDYTGEMSESESDSNQMDLSSCENTGYSFTWNYDSSSSSWTTNSSSVCGVISGYAEDVFENIYTNVGDLESGYLHCSVLAYGAQGEVDCYYDISYIGTETDFGACFQWTAEDFSTWKSQWDITIGGIFPDMFSAMFFEDMLSIDDDDIFNDEDEDECSDFFFSNEEAVQDQNSEEQNSSQDCSGFYDFDSCSMYPMCNWYEEEGYCSDY